MSKYRITVENIGEGAEYKGTPIECDGFVIAADQCDEAEYAIWDANTLEIARMIAASDELCGAARIDMAIHEAMREKRSTTQVITTLVEALRGKD